MKTFRFLIPSSNFGIKRRFGMAGLFNVITTNVILQALLAYSILSVSICTLISQAFNFVAGYNLYGRLVFNSRSLGRYTNFLRYLFLSIFLWISNTSGINLLVGFGISKGVSALIMILPLSMISFIIQRFLIFKS